MNLWASIENSIFVYNGQPKRNGTRYSLLLACPVKFEECFTGLGEGLGMRSPNQKELRWLLIIGVLLEDFIIRKSILISI